MNNGSIKIVTGILRNSLHFAFRSDRCAFAAIDFRTA